MKNLNNKNKMFLVLAALILQLVITNNINVKAQNYRYDKLHVESKSIKPGGASSVKVLLSFVGGEMNISGGADNLMDAKFTYTKNSWKPEIYYKVENDSGKLFVKMPKIYKNFNFSHFDLNEWDVHLNNNIPLDLRIKLIGGKGNFDLQELSLENLKIALGGGEFDINLANTSVPRLEFTAFAGEAVLDLSGIWKNDLEAEFNCGFGELTLKLPKDVGVRLHITGLLGSINSPGFKKKGKTYVNEAYNKSDITLQIDISGGIGTIDLHLVD